MNRSFEKRKHIAEEMEHPSWEETLKDFEVEHYEDLVTVDVDSSLLDRDGLETLEKSRELFIDMTKAVAKEFRVLLQERPISKKMREFLEANGLIDANISIMNGDVAQEFLRDNDLVYTDFNKDNLIAVFNLPKPLSKFWFKGGEEEWGKNAQAVNDDIANHTVVEWGWFYRGVIRKVWDLWDSSDSKGVYLERINGQNQHDLDKYYYIWSIKNSPYYDRYSNEYNDDD